MKSNYTLATTLYGSPGSPYTNRYTNPNDENGQQVTEATAKSNAHYATTLGWDMEKVWAHVDNDYPILRWMKTNGGATGINHIKTTDRDGTVRYYDLQGRYIGTSLNSLPAGVYIGGGKKIMKK